MVNLQMVAAWLRALQRVYAENREELTRLDADIGDGDHGINMDRGFTAVAAELDGGTPASIGQALKAAAMTLLRTVGGAAGPLYGTFFLRAASAAEGKESLGPGELAALFRLGLEGVKQRGQAQVGDKTMVDCLQPAVEALEQAASAGRDLQAVLAAGEAAAEAGARATVPLVARKGRASYLGERSIGHQDPGATSAWLLLRTARESWTGESSGNSAPGAAARHSEAGR